MSKSQKCIVTSKTKQSSINILTNIFKLLTFQLKHFLSMCVQRSTHFILLSELKFTRENQYFSLQDIVIELNF